MACQHTTPALARSADRIKRRHTVRVSVASSVDHMRHHLEYVSQTALHRLMHSTCRRSTETSTSTSASTAGSTRSGSGAINKRPVGLDPDSPLYAYLLAHTREQSLPAIIELRYDGNLITPNATLETIRKTAEAQGK